MTKEKQERLIRLVLDQFLTIWDKSYEDETKEKAKNNAVEIIMGIIPDGVTFPGVILKDEKE